MLIEALFVSIFVLLGEIQFVFRPAFSSSYFVLKKCYDYNQMSTFSGLISDWTSSMLGNSSPRCREGTKSSVESILSLNDDISGVSIVWLPLPTSMLSSMFSRKSSGVCGMDNVGPIPSPLSADSWREWSVKPERNGSIWSSVLLPRIIRSCCLRISCCLCFRRSRSNCRRCKRSCCCLAGEDWGDN